MEWKIKNKVKDNDGIIKIQYSNNRIDWDFALGSEYEFCAIFSRVHGETLEDLKREKVRPIIYRKNSRMYHMVPNESNVVSYGLYPALIEHNVFCIGNQKRGNIIYLKKESNDIKVTLMKEQKRKWLFFFKSKKFRPEEVKLLFEGDEWNGKLYYTIAKQDMRYKYAVDVNEKDISIRLGLEQEAEFYSDDKCIKRMKSEKNG